MFEVQEHLVEKEYFQQWSRCVVLGEKKKSFIAIHLTSQLIYIT